MKKRICVFVTLLCLLVGSVPVYAYNANDIDNMPFMRTWITGFGNKALGSGPDGCFFGEKNFPSGVNHNGYDEWYQYAVQDNTDGFLLKYIKNNKEYFTYFTRNKDAKIIMYNRGASSTSKFSMTKNQKGYWTQHESGVDSSWFGWLGDFYAYSSTSLSSENSRWYMEPDFTIDYDAGMNSDDLYNFLVQYKGKKPSLDDDELPMLTYTLKRNTVVIFGSSGITVGENHPHAQ